MESKIFLQTVYIPRENIFFLEEWLNYHTNLGVDEFWLYDNSGSKYLDFVGNLEINGKDRHGNLVSEKTKNLSDVEILDLEKKIFDKFNVKKIIWQPRDTKNNITYNQIGAIYDFKEKVGNGVCCFIDIDEFIFLNNYYNIKHYVSDVLKPNLDAIQILQKRYLTRWSNPKNVLSISKTFEINTKFWAPKFIGKIEHIKKIPNRNIHNFFENFLTEEYFCYFKHFNHNINVHNWLLMNYKSIDSLWIPKTFDKVFD